MLPIRYNSRVGALSGEGFLLLRRQNQVVAPDERVGQVMLNP